jgi:glycosyltransferase involved in cell wall biosynthesis
MSSRLRAPQQPNGHEKAIFSAAFELTSEFELPARPNTSRGRPYDEARLLVRISGEPVGFVTVTLASEPLSRDSVFRAIKRDLADSVDAELARQGLPALPSLNGAVAATPWHELTAHHAHTVSVVVCTRNRAHALSDCLVSLTRLEDDAIEFVIVDNAPADESTKTAVMKAAHDDPRFAYVCEPLPGLSRARNCGLALARGEVVAYTDDDVRVDPLWVKGLLRGFARAPEVACVTGLVASASLEWPAEQYFDGRVWWSSSCEPTVYDGDCARSALYPYAAGAFGTGANFAAHGEVLRKIGGFDESLGAGSPCDGGEDLDIFVRFIRAGYSISYEPAALVWHEHRAGAEDLRQQMYAYGKALSAYLFKYASSPATAGDVLRRLPQGLRHLGVLGARSRRVGGQTGLSYDPVIAEMRGLLAGPLAYVRARRAQDPARRRAVAP